MELHHIEQRADDGEGTYDNCIPLCFDCHADVNSYNDRHPKGKKYTASELKGHRNKWYEKVRNGHSSIANSDHLELDRKLFLRIRNILSSGSISSIRNHDYGGSFDTERHKELFELLYLCELPECEFLDPDIEGLRAKLKEDIEKFTRSIGQNTFPLPGNISWNRIPRDPRQEFETIAWFKSKAKSDEEFDNLIEEQLDHISKIHRELNVLSQQMCHSYDEFIRLGRRKLAVD